MRSLTVVPIQRRLAAAVLSAALAVGAVFPPAGFALVGEGDQEQEGTADPGAPAAPDTTADPDFDPGGEDVLPFDVGTPTDDGDDGAAVESEPVQDPDALAALPDEPEDDPASNVAAPPLGDAAPAPLPAPAPAPPAVEATPPAPPAAEPTTEPPAGRERATTKRKRDRAERRAKRTRPAPHRVVMIPAPAPVPVAATAAPAAPVTAAAETTTPSVARGSRTYAVRAGDCLWTIAVALLGDELDGLTEADRNGRIQARVDRLYTLNRDRIGPDPSVVKEGTVLRLR